MFSEQALQMLRNPNAIIIKKYIFEILKDKYPKHEELIERIGLSLITKNDTENFGKLIAETFEAGYLKAIEDHRIQLEKLGIRFEMGYSQKGEKIFPD